MKITETKIELHARGVRIDRCHLKELYSRYDWDHSGFYIQDVPVIVRYGKWSETSPYEVRELDGGHALFEDERLLTHVSLLQRPRFLRKKTSDGVPMYKIGELLFTGNFSLLLNQECGFWKTGQQCCFCTVGKQAFLKTKTPEQVLEAARAGLDEGVLKGINLVTGYQPGPDAGTRGVAEATRVIKEHLDVPVCASDVCPPEDDRYLELLAEAGADTIMINVESFDPSTRARGLPGKGRIDMDRYTKAWEKAVELFDENQVASRIFAGLGESDSSILEGAGYLAGLGVIPYLTPVHPSAGSRMDGQRPPKAERMARLYLGVADIIKDHGLDPFKTRAGMVTSGGESALKEVLRFGLSRH